MAPSLRRAAAERGDLTSTSATMFSADSASARLPSLVGIMLRTVPPPDGIFQVWNFSVLGAKRTRVLGLAPDSLYQRTSPTACRPSGAEPIPARDIYCAPFP